MKVLLIPANTEQINIPVMPLGLACVKQAAKEAGHEVQGLNLMDTVLREVGDTASYAFGPVRGTTTIGKGVLDLSDDIFGTLERAAAELDGMVPPSP